MLVLSRKLREKIVLPGLEIEIQVLRIAGRHVQLGITAPGHIGVYREEVLGRNSPQPSLTEANAISRRDC
jgi:carbon storage regulator